MAYDYAKEMELGKIIVNKIKSVFYDDKSWPECYREVAEKFRTMKRIMRKFYIIENNIDILNNIDMT